MSKIRMGMIGGGPNAFIGAIHRMAALLDGEISLVCGVFSQDSLQSNEFGQSLGLSAKRCYQDYDQMLSAEALLPAPLRMQFVVIVTPNNLHFPMAKLALQRGFHVLSDKPATLSVDQALMLQNIIGETNRLYGLTHTYNGYPMVKEAKHRVAQGQLGNIRKVVVEYSQDWLSSDNQGKQAKWRLDPAQAGISCCMADIGVHAANLAEYISGLEITDVCAQLNSVIDGRVLDDDGAVLLKFNQTIPGVLIASQVATGEENNLNIRIYGELASIEWSQQQPDSLQIKYPNRSSELCRMGVGQLADTTMANSRTPAGHPQGYIEAFANIYRAFGQQIRDFEQNQHQLEADVPGIDAALRGMRFIEAVVAASQSNIKWHKLPTSAQTAELTSTKVTKKELADA
ncbi:MAG: putative dehydrogenase [Phenylobacterium sp.]|jgi:predicted dehydrogenase